jgi:hypothetical protein
MERNRARIQANFQAVRASCPIGFFVQRKGTWSTVVTKGLDGSDVRLGMGLDLNFRTQAHAVVEADVTVHGMTPRPRIIGALTSTPEDAAEDFALKGTADAPLKMSSVWMKRLGTVSWVELTRVVFSDGTAWTPVGNAHCTARPSLMVLVGGSAQSR